jgi:hypothetical protein
MQYLRPCLPGQPTMVIGAATKIGRLSIFTRMGQILNKSGRWLGTITKTKLSAEGHCVDWVYSWVQEGNHVRALRTIWSALSSPSRLSRLSIVTESRLRKRWSRSLISLSRCFLTFLLRVQCHWQVHYYQRLESESRIVLAFQEDGKGEREPSVRSENDPRRITDETQRGCRK